MGHHERFRSELAATFEAQKKEANLDGDVLLSIWTEDETSVSLVEYGRRHGGMHRAIKEREEASSAAAPEEKALASEPASEAPRSPSSSPECIPPKIFSSCCTCPAFRLLPVSV